MTAQQEGGFTPPKGTRMAPTMTPTMAHTTEPTAARTAAPTQAPTVALIDARVVQRTVLRELLAGCKPLTVTLRRRTEHTSYAQEQPAGSRAQDPYVGTASRAAPTARTAWGRVRRGARRRRRQRRGRNQRDRGSGTPARRPEEPSWEPTRTRRCACDVHTRRIDAPLLAEHDVVEAH
jgi:hypothetical protein